MIGNATIRGISSKPELKEQQTFAMNIPLVIIDTFRRLYMSQVESRIEVSKRRAVSSYRTYDNILELSAALPANTPMKELVAEKEKMNKLMQTYIDRVRADPNTYIK